MSGIVRRIRLLSLFLAMTATMLTTTSCSDVDKVVKALNDGIREAQQTSDSWRAALKDTLTELDGLESQVSSDVKGTLDDTINYVTQFRDQSFAQADYYAKDTISYAAIQAECSAEYFAKSVVQSLEFWRHKIYPQSKDPLTTQRVCLFNPDHLDIDPNTPLTSPKTWVVNVFGYNFFPDVLPVLGIYDGNNQLVRVAKSLPIRTSVYQMQLQLTMADYGQLGNGYRVGLKWPNGDANFISLNLSAPAHLKLLAFNFPSMVTVNHAVVPQVTVTNTGTVDSGAFRIIWTPDVTQSKVSTANELSLAENQTQTYELPSYSYAQFNYFRVPQIAGAMPVQTSVQIVGSTGVSNDTFATANFTLNNLPFHLLAPITINEPTVTSDWTNYQWKVGVRPGDIVVIRDAGGCVQIGGIGLTWKRYVFPYAPGAPNLYHGLIAIYPLMPKNDGAPPPNATRIEDVLNTSIPIPLDTTNPEFYLGYADDGYSDNGYYSHDNGTANQCLNVGDAFVTVQILRN